MNSEGRGWSRRSPRGSRGHLRAWKLGLTDEAWGGQALDRGHTGRERPTPSAALPPRAQSRGSCPPFQLRPRAPEEDGKRLWGPGGYPVAGRSDASSGPGWAYMATVTSSSDRLPCTLCAGSAPPTTGGGPSRSPCTSRSHTALSGTWAACSSPCTGLVGPQDEDGILRGASGHRQGCPLLRGSGLCSFAGQWRGDCED